MNDDQPTAPPPLDAPPKIETSEPPITEAEAIIIEMMARRTVRWWVAQHRAPKS